MKFLNKILFLFCLSVPFIFPVSSYAVDEVAERDDNHVPALIGVSEINTEIRRLKTTDDGVLLIQSTGTATATTIVDVSGSDALFLSTFSVSGSNVEIMAADANRESSLICNEGPEIARVGPTATLTSTVGQRLLVDQCFTLDAAIKPYRGAVSAVSTTGILTKIATIEAS